MEINTEKYGTTGLPKFGPGHTYGAVEGAAKTGVESIDGAFNNLITVVRKNCLPGNTMGLWFFGLSAKALYSIAYALVTEKPVINA